MIELETPNGAIFIRPEAVEAIEAAPRHAAAPDRPASLIFTSAGTAFPVAGTPAEIRDRVCPGVASAEPTATARTQAFDAGVDFTLRVLAEHLDAREWSRVVETGSFHCDLQSTIEGILSRQPEAETPQDRKRYVAAPEVRRSHSG